MPTNYIVAGVIAVALDIFLVIGLIRYVKKNKKKKNNNPVDTQKISEQLDNTIEK